MAGIVCRRRLATDALPAAESESALRFGGLLISVRVRLKSPASARRPGRRPSCDGCGEDAGSKSETGRGARQPRRSRGGGASAAPGPPHRKTSATPEFGSRSLR